MLFLMASQPFSSSPTVLRSQVEELLGQEDPSPFFLFIEGFFSEDEDVRRRTQDDLTPFYGMLMPTLKPMLATANKYSNLTLLVKSLECIAVVAAAVGKSVFSPDANEIVELLISVQECNSNLKGKDRVTNYLLQAWSQICTTLREDFQPYLSSCMPQLIELAAQEDYLIAHDWKDKNELKSIVLKEMFWACNTLSIVASSVKGGLDLWIDEVLKALLPLINFRFDEQVRVAAILVMPSLLQYAATAMQKKLPDFANTIIPALVKALEASTIRIQVKTLEALRGSIQIAQTWAPDDTKIFDSMLKVLSACFYKKTEREKKAKGSMKFTRPQLLKGEIEDEENLCREVRVCLHALMKRIFDRNLILHTYYVKYMWENDIIPEERRMALNIFSDIAREGGEQCLRHYAADIPFLLNACNDINPYIQEIAACAIGIFAEFGRETFKHHLQGGVSSLEAIFRKAAFDLEHNMAKDAAVSAYGKLCFFFSEEINMYKGIDIWLFHLPLRCNFEEAKAAHRLLCFMIDKPESKVTGTEDSYICRILAIMAEVLWAGNNIATEETQSKMIQQLKMFKKRLSADNFVAICKSLPTFLQNALSVYMSS